MSRAEQSRAEQSRAEQSRNIGLDLYRIIAAFLITIIHMFGYNNPIESAGLSNGYSWYLSIVYSLNLLGINGFIIISSYFLAKSEFKIKRIVSFILELQFVAVIVFIGYVVVARDISGSNAIKSIFPILTQHYWYPISYLILLALSPLLNKGLSKLTQRNLKALLIILTTGFAFITVNPFYSGNVFIGHSTHSMLWFITIYVIAYYLRWYEIKNEKLMRIPLFLTCFVILVILNLVKMVRPFSGLLSRIELTGNDSILSLGLLVSSFLIFKSIRFFPGNLSRKILSVIVPSTWIVYLFQEHCCVRAELWTYVNVSQYQYAKMPVVSAILGQLATFWGILAVSIIIYLIYKVAYKVYLGKIETFICGKIEKFLRVCQIDET